MLCLCFLLFLLEIVIYSPFYTKMYRYSISAVAEIQEDVKYQVFIVQSKPAELGW